MVDLQVQGANKLDALAKELKRVGDRQLSKELYAGLNRATKPLKADAKESALQKLPRRGGLAKRVSRSRLSTRRSGGSNPGVKIVAKGLDQLRLMDEQGRVRHPVYGRGKFVDQRIPEAQGWFTDSLQAGVPTVRQELIKVLDEIARQVARK